MSEHKPHNIDELKGELQHHDEWFRHAPDESHQSPHGDFNPYVVMGFLAITIVIVFGVAFMIVPWFGRLVQAQRVAVREGNLGVTQEYREARDRWEGDLFGAPQWVDEKAGVVRVPIDLAMDQVVRFYQQGGR